MKNKIAIAIAFIVLISSGCWYYSFTDKPYPDIETVMINPFENETTEYDLGDRLTTEVIDDIDGSGLLKVRNQNADSEIFGVINSMSRSVHTYTSDETPEEYKISIRAKISFRDLNKDKTLWSSTFEGYGTYPSDGDDEEAINQAMELLIQRIIQRLRDG